MLYARLREKSERDYEIPFSKRRRVAVETLRDWLRLYRKGGFDALLPRPRSDNGLCRALPRDLSDWLVEYKDSHRELTVPKLLEKAVELGKVEDGVKLSTATVHRLLAQHGLNRAENADRGTDRRHFEYEQAGELWMSDVMHGPGVVVADKRKRKTYLIGIIDDATRLVPYAAFAMNENTASYLPVLKQAVLRRGVPKRFVRRQWLGVSDAPSSRGLRSAWDHPDPRSALPTIGERKAGTIFQNGADALFGRNRCGIANQPDRPQSSFLGVGRGGVPSRAASGTRRRVPARSLGGAVGRGTDGAKRSL